MSIAFPVARFSLAASGTSTARAAVKKTSWLNRNADVRKNVETIYRALDADTRSSEEASVKQEGLASTVSTKDDVHTDSNLVNVNASTTWKGKGRALMEPDGVPPYKIKSRAYVTEGIIARPTTKFFNANAHASRAAEADSRAAQGQTTPLEQFPAMPPWLPRTTREARELVLQLDTSDRKLAKLRQLLRALSHTNDAGQRRVAEEVEISALQACLSLKVVSTPRQLKQGGIDSKTYLRAWARLWQLTGDTSNMEPELARSILSDLLTFPVAPSSPWARYHNTVRPIRHLLFLAGIESNQALAVDVLGQLLQTNPIARTELPPKIVASSAINVNDVVLLLQDLLRSGVFSPDLVKAFKLSEIISSAPSVPEATFKTLLQQTLFRIMLQWYLDHKEFARAMRLCQHLDLGFTFEMPLKGTNAEAFKHAFEIGMEGAVYNTAAVTTAWQSLHRMVSQRSEWHAGHEVTVDALKGTTWEAIQGFFSQFLSRRPLVSFAMPQVCGAAILLRDARESRDQSFVPSRLLGKPQLLYIIRFMASSSPDEVQEYLRTNMETTNWGNVIISTASEVAESLAQRRFKVDNEEANEILGAVLAAVKGSEPLDTTRTMNILASLLQHFNTENEVKGDFCVSSSHLAALVRYICQQGEAATVAGIPAGRSLIDDYMQARSAWKSIPSEDYSALAGAFAEVGDMASAREVLRQKLAVQLVPSLVDYEIMMKSLSVDDPDLATTIAEKASKAGLNRVSP